MRKVFLLAALVVACAKKEAPPADTAAAAPPPPPPPPPALTAADVKGTWNGTGKREGSDSTITWTVTTVSDSTGKLTFPNKETVTFATKFDADSMVSTSAAYKDPSLPKNAPKVMFKSVAHLKDGKLVGTATLVLAAKPDSVVGKSTWEATKAP